MVFKRNPNLGMEDVWGLLGKTIQEGAVAPNINAYKPHDKQVNFHTNVDKRIRLYIGGNRSGKTVGGIVEDIWWLTKRHPYRKFGPGPIKGRIVTVDFINGTQQIIIPKLKQWIPPSELRGGNWTDAYQASIRTLFFDNGSQVELMSYDQDLDKFAGTDRDFIHYDEEPPEAIYEECQARLIDRGGHAWITMTPVEGMTWVYDQIYLPGSQGTKKNVHVTEVSVQDNPYVNQEAAEEFLEGLDDDKRAAREHGTFIQLGGLVYKNFDPKIHIIPPVDPKEFHGADYKHYLALDHGYNNPTAVLWSAVDKNNQVVTYAEHYERERIVEYHAQVIHTRNELHGRIPDICVCDPALAQRNGVTGTSIQTEYAVHGIGFALGNNDVPTGVAKVNQYINTVGPNGRPNWVITENCQNLIREISRLRWQTWATKKQASQNNAHDKIHKKDDHACDAARYFFTLMPELKPTKKKTERLVLPEIGGNNAVLPGYRIDQNLTPDALAGKNKTEWHRIDLRE